MKTHQPRRPPTTLRLETRNRPGDECAIISLPSRVRIPGTYPRASGTERESGRGWVPANRTYGLSLLCKNNQCQPHARLVISPTNNPTKLQLGHVPNPNCVWHVVISGQLSVQSNVTNCGHVHVRTKYLQSQLHDKIPTPTLGFAFLNNAHTKIKPRLKDGA